MPQFDGSLGAGAGAGQPVGKGQGTQGRGDGQGGEGISGGGHAGSKNYSPQPASVVIRATVEHIGLVGDTELTVNVKWPASIFCVQPCAKPAAPSVQASDSQNVPANGPDASNFDGLYGESTADPAPYDTVKSEDELTKVKSELTDCKTELTKLTSEGKPTSS